MKTFKILCLALFLTLVQPFNLKADQPAPQTQPQSHTQNAPVIQTTPYPAAPDLLTDQTAVNGDEDTRFFSAFLNTMITLGFIISLILIATWVLKRLVNTKIQQTNTTSLMKIIERRNLTPKTTLYLLNIMGKGLVVAETHTGLSLITEVPLGDLSITSITNDPKNFEKVIQDKFKDK